jgi:hypothetical protein
VAENPTVNVTKDKSGHRIEVGSIVRVLLIDPSLIKSLPPDEREQVESMIGEQLVVIEINEYGYAVVEKEWRIGPDQYASHSISLASNEMELIQNAT